MNYFGLEAEYASQDNAAVAIVPVPYELTTSYGKGTELGPQAILTASQQVELFDDELWNEPYKVGIETLAPVKPAAVNASTEKPFEELRTVVAEVLQKGQFPIVLGGEHALSLGPVKACIERYPNLSILQIDAHADCRKSYKGNPYSHASVTYQMHKILPSGAITQVGIRNVSAEEVQWFKEEKPQIEIFFAHKQSEWDFAKIVDTLTDDVYLTIDVDGLDSGIMPSTGTPEPGGMSWQQLTELIRVLCAKKNVVAADIVELSPIEGLHAPDFLVAKLLYKLVGYRFADKLKLMESDFVGAHCMRPNR